MQRTHPEKMHRVLAFQDKTAVARFDSSAKRSGSSKCPAEMIAGIGRIRFAELVLRPELIVLRRQAE
jgi:hypothetical protein